MGLANSYNVPIPNETTYAEVVSLNDYKKIKEVKEKDVIKYNKDGSIKKTTSNKKKGESSEVYAFRTKEEIDAMLNVFNNHIENATTKTNKKLWCRNKMLFIIGMNIGIRGSDLCRLKWIDILYDDFTFRDTKKICPKKTENKGKFVTIAFNDRVKKTIMEYIEKYPIEDLNDYIFKSKKGNHIKRVSIGEMLKKVAKEANIKQNINSHSLRKTYGYWTYKSAENKSEALAKLQYGFGHCSMKDTMKYIGIAQESISEFNSTIDLGCE